MALLRDVLSRGQDEARLHALLGAALFEMGRRKESRAALAVALRREPDQPLARQYLERLGPGPSPQPAQ